MQLMMISLFIYEREFVVFRDQSFCWGYRDNSEQKVLSYLKKLEAPLSSTTIYHNLGLSPLLCHNHSDPDIQHKFSPENIILTIQKALKNYDSPSRVEPSLQEALQHQQAAQL